MSWLPINRAPFETDKASGCKRLAECLLLVNGVTVQGKMELGMWLHRRHMRPELWEDIVPEPTHWMPMPPVQGAESQQDVDTVEGLLERVWVGAATSDVRHAAYVLLEEVRRDLPAPSAVTPEAISEWLVEVAHGVHHDSRVRAAAVALRAEGGVCVKPAVGGMRKVSAGDLIEAHFKATRTGALGGTSNWAYEVLRHLQATTGAASLCSDKPVAWVAPDGKGGAKFGSGWMFSPVQTSVATMPVYSRGGSQ